MKKVKGLAGARGQDFGKCVVLKESIYNVQCVKVDDTCNELAKLETARKRYCEELDDLYEKSICDIGKGTADIFLAYKEIVNDNIFFEKCSNRVLKEQINIEYVLQEEKKEITALFCGMSDPYMRERGKDIEHVCDALIRKMLGVITYSEQIDKIKEDFILVARDLAPTDTIRLDKTYLRGFVIEKGGQTSHTVILAKTLGIPAVVGADSIMDHAAENDIICIDGGTGEIIIQPEQSILVEYKKARIKAGEQYKKLKEVERREAKTRDGNTVSICANAGDEEGIRNLDLSFCDGIGLFRTEFIYMAANRYPSEEMQSDIYKKLAEKAQGKEVIIRTLDIGGDKKVDYMGLPVEDNPFLGYRAIRICLENKEMFKVQLRAILRASAYGKLSIMFPMIVNMEELRAAKQLVSECMKELEEAGIPYDKTIKMGIMIETPAAVILSDRLAQEADFFSIGTNDLIQYITATDRMNEKVQNLYRICNISVLRAIKTVVQNAHKEGIKVGICGEAASDERMVPVWLGMGIDKLSMVVSQIARIKYIISQMSVQQAQDITTQILDFDNTDDIEKYLEKQLKKYAAIL